MSTISSGAVDGSAGWNVRPPRAGAPGVKFSTAFAEAGSGHSGYGVGFALPQTRLTIAPLTTRWPAAVATGVASTTWVESGIDVITRVVFVIVPVEFVCGIVSVKPSSSALVSATVSVAVFEWSPTTVASRGGHAVASRTTQDFGCRLHPVRARRTGSA